MSVSECFGLAIETGVCGGEQALIGGGEGNDELGMLNDEGAVAAATAGGDMEAASPSLTLRVGVGGPALASQAGPTLLSAAVVGWGAGGWMVWSASCPSRSERTTLSSAARERRV